MKHRILAAVAGACALALGACQTTAIDGRIAQVSTRLAERCADLQTAAVAVDLFAPEKLRAAARDAEAALATFCAKPPKNVAQALVALADAYAAIEAARTSR
ncbi:hypothetical protein FG93_01928 [Bosea sp. LC85]|uniref:hypothetical protein n=1 Tax=Bosea sp. LC85 TaxID=1502851 RepID=UPI0004E35F1E|nr:hypothetical protein [Bosea sp. LC85]KFC73184.1 hypothetical protein FG93_01928 [Bosea sp. LC85]